MNDSEATARIGDGADQVQVEITDCPAEDAHTVFGALNALFSSDRATEDVPQSSAGPGPTVWTMTVDVSAAPAAARPGRLTEPVTVTLQGGPWAADRLHAGLASVFTVQDAGSASGDQEQERQLRLSTRQIAA
ncbi:hypothetical protein [Streptomyces lydicus]|uniref:Uncharacterized protein n=1 Tax=Streptomyces lydicus TaxID=47763 RepID=A0A1D7VMB2_9ACTN|nr:hypothetical protein [Streptomyces lydicus]AOP47895.1 hypothetical protein SL103_18090 [Streptomyces lydicus]